MDNKRLDRRRALSGGLAFAAACAVAVEAGALPPSPSPAADGDGGPVGAELVMPVEFDDREFLGPDPAEEAARHAPFRAAFLAWLGEASGRFALPVAADAVAAAPYTDLRVPGLHPAVEITLYGDTDINVFATWGGVCWDIVASMDVYAKPAPDGPGWRNELLIPEARRLRPTHEACWREDGFEGLLRWFNEELAPATHLALYGGDGCYQGEGWTSADLARDGVLMRSGWPVAGDHSLRELLPLHAARA